MRALHRANSLLRPSYALILFAAFALLAMPQGLATNVGTGVYLPLSASLHEAASLLKVSDNAYYTQTAMQFLSPAPLDSTGQWAIRQWPPGFPALLAAPALVLGDGYPVGLWMLILNGLAWTGVFHFMVLLCRSTRYRIGVTAIGILVFTSPPFRDWITSTGYLYTEGLATAAACLSILIALSATRCLHASSRGYRVLRPAYLLSAGAGALLAFGAYLRATYEFVALGLTVGTVVAVILLVAVRFVCLLRGRDHMARIGASTLRRSAIALVVASLTAQALMLPWRVYVYEQFANSLSWTIQTDVYWGLRWAPTAYLNQTGSGWFAEWGGNSACRIAPDECVAIAASELKSPGPYSGGGAHSQDQFKRAAIDAYLAHPTTWIRDRASLVMHQWFVGSYRLPVRIFWGAIFFAALALGIIGAILGILRRRLVAPFVYLSIVGGTLGPLLLQLVEVRYLFPAELCSITYVLALWIYHARGRAGTPN